MNFKNNSYILNHQNCLWGSKSKGLMLIQSRIGDLVELLKTLQVKAHSLKTSFSNIRGRPMFYLVLFPKSVWISKIHLKLLLLLAILQYYKAIDY